VVICCFVVLGTFYYSSDDLHCFWITVVQEVMVCDQVKFTMGNESGVILLPWAPGVHQDAKLKAVGG
jgi:hypothetical protein